MQNLPIQFVNANGIKFGYLSQGQGPLVLCLHGFPDTAYTYVDLMQRLSAEGYRVVAPFTRGYAPTGIPADKNYSMEDFGKDAIALIEALGEQKAYLIGHDWGASAVYAACSLAPEKVIKAVTAAVPHPQALKFNAAQLKKSWYIFFFQLRLISEWRLKRNNYALIDKLWSDWSPALSKPNSIDLINALKQALNKQENLLAALGYYRALFKGANIKRTQKLLSQPINVPTLTIAGELDGCIGAEHFPAMKPLFNKQFELFVMQGAGHFMHQEQSEVFANTVSNFFKQN